METRGQTLHRGIAALAAVALLASCTSTGNGEAGTGIGNQISKYFESRGNRYCLQAGAIGAGGGAAAGALIGRGIAGGHNNTGAMLAGAVTGAIIGGMTACRYGVWVADRRESYELSQAQLTAELVNAQETNGSLTELNRELSQGLSARQREISALKESGVRTQQEFTNKTQLANELEQNRQGLEQQLQASQKELSAHQSALAQIQKSGGKVDEAELQKYRSQIAAMEKSVATLQQLNQQYASALSQASAL